MTSEAVLAGDDPSVDDDPSVRDTTDAPTGGRFSRRPSAPALAHGLTLLAGAAFILHIDRHVWFVGDDWDFLVLRGLHHPFLSIWQPHNEHWSTLPILLWRALYTLFGLHHFLPYLVPVVVAHLVTAHLMWRIMRRVGVDSWVAVATAGVFIVLGAGAENLAWAFQIGFVASVTFGYAAMAVALSPHRPTPVRTVVTALLLLAGLMCSSIGDPMVVAVGVALLLARGWRRTAVTLVLPVVGYLVWYERVGRHAVAAQDKVTQAVVLGIPTFVFTGLADALGRASGFDAAGPVLLVALAAWFFARFTTLRAKPEVVGFSAGAVAFLLLVSLARQQYGDSPASRYIYIIVALLLPLVAVVVSAALDRSRRLLVVGLFAFVAVANVGLFETWVTGQDARVSTQRADVLSVATLLAEGVPSINQDPVPGTGRLTAATLLGLERSGQLPRVAVSEVQRMTDLANMDVLFGPVTASAEHLHLVAAADLSLATETGGCVLLTPTGAGPQIILAGPSGSTAVFAGPPGSGYQFYVGSPAGLASPGVLPVTGRASLYERVGRARLTISLPTGGATTICGLRA